MRGFTLIETLLYIALLGLIIGGSIMAAYSLMGVAARARAASNLEDEGNFLTAKLDWALNQTKTINQPLPNSSGQALDLATPDGDRLIFTTIGEKKLELQTNNSPALPLNNDETQITNINFARRTTDGQTDLIEINFSLTTLTQTGLSLTQNFSISSIINSQ